MGFTVAELERELLVDRLQNNNTRLEIEEARGNLGSLADRLDVSLNQDGTLRPSELNIDFVRDESSIVASAIDGAWLILDGDRSSVYVVDRRVRFNDNDTLTGFVQTAVYDAEADETTITFQEAAGVVINAIGFSFNPNTVSKIHHSELADILPAIEGADDTKNKHVSNLQLLNKVPYAQGIRRVADINALRLLTPDLCTVVFIECHTTPGDRGHGTFYWDAASTDADDWQNTIAVTGISTGRWKRNIDPITDELLTHINLTTAQAISDAKFYVDNQFVTQVLYQADIDNIQSQLDGQVVAWFYTGYDPTTANIPANAWTTTAIKEQHADDTFTRLDTGQSWRWVYEGGVWKWVEIMDTATTAALSLAAQAQDTADGKRRVFVTQPTVPYDVGDLWTTATTLKRCVTAKTSAGIFAEGDWISAADVTDYLTIYDTAQGYANSAQTQALLDAQTYADGKFVTQVLHQAAIDNLQGQLDGQVIAWFYDYAPTLSNAPASLWTTEALRNQHANDTFTHLTTGQSWRWVYDTGAWKWLEIADTATTAALAAASQAQDTADNKRRVFVAQPTVPYDVGDLWADGSTLLRCVTPKTSTGSYAAGDWLAVADKTDYDDYRVSNVKTENGVTTIARPAGGTYYNSGASVTGVIKITLPQSWSSTLMKFGVDIRQYNTTKSFTLQLGGYNHISSSIWINSFAQLAGSTASNNRVRFGHDGTKCCILIGDVTSEWNNPSVVVKDFQASHSNYTRDKWETGWVISIVTDISGITTTADIADTLIDAKSILGQGALATQNTADYGTQVTGTKPPATATDNSAWSSPNNLEQIDMNAIDGRTVLRVLEGGAIQVGDSNIILDSADNGSTEGRIIVAPNGGTTGQDYVQIDNGEVSQNIYDPITDSHYRYKSLNRIEFGQILANGANVVKIPGFWKATPVVMITPVIVGLYVANAQLQDQELHLNTGVITRQPGQTRKYQFTPSIELKIASGVSSVGLTNEGLFEYLATKRTETVTLPGGNLTITTYIGEKVTDEVYPKLPNLRQIAVTIGSTFCGAYNYVNNWFWLSLHPVLELYVNGVGWIKDTNATGSCGKANDLGNPNVDFSWTITSSTQSADITAWRIRWMAASDTKYHKFNWSYETVTLVLSSSVLLSSGLVNWIAMGE